MILLFKGLRGRTFWEMLGIFNLVSLLVCVAFNFEISKTYTYYRELFGGLFGGLWLWQFATSVPSDAGASLRVHKTMFYLILFPVLLVIWSLIDSGISLYGETSFSEVSENLSASNVTLYVLRNALLYLPMVFYFSRRGLREQELQLIALAAVLVAPFSIAAYLTSSEIGSLLAINLLADSGHRSGIAYNSYVPFLTFPVTCGIYLLFDRFGLLFKAVVLLCISITSLFILISTSRQSLLFIIMSGISFFYFSQEKDKLLNLAKFAMAVGMVALAFTIFSGDFQFGDNFFNRFSSLDGGAEKNKAFVWLEGLLMLEPDQWFMGAGLTSIINSGPHNDYIRWTQRVGVVVMLIGFMPFFVAFRSSLRSVRSKKQGNLVNILLCLCIGFTLYHSFFGYPREDAYQAPYVYLGLAFWFGVLRQGKIDSFKNPNAIYRHSAEQTSGMTSKLS